MIVAFVHARSVESLSTRARARSHRILTAQTGELFPGSTQAKTRVPTVDLELKTPVNRSGM